MTHYPNHDKVSFLKSLVSKRLLVLNIMFAVIYFSIIAFDFKHGNEVLFIALILGELFHLFQIVGYSYTVWSHKTIAAFSPSFSEAVDIFITVCGEPVDIVRETAVAALAIDYPNFNVFLLNDGYVAKKDNWQEIDALATELGIKSITRHKPGGAKAGNINNGLRNTNSPYFVVFDADHVPHRDFLRRVMGYFTDPKMGFVQTPQFYKNQAVNRITQTAWDQQTLFFGPIMRGKNRLNSAFMCGTNMVLNRTAILEAGGMCEFNIAEDFLTSLFVHAKGWKSYYYPKVMAEGLAPEDFLSYYKQQFRWTRGSLEVIFKYNPLFMRGLSWAQRFQYLISASYYLSGVVILIDMLLPIVFLFTGLTAIHTSTMILALIFLPYIFTNLFILQLTSNYSYSFSAISYSLSSFYLQLRAIVAVLTNQKTSFAVTPKSQQQGNFTYLVIPHLIYTTVAVIGMLYALHHDGFSASFMANFSWALVNICIFLPFIRASLPQRKQKASRPAASIGIPKITTQKAAE